ncbi:hypothetical protein HHI36_020580 [Cryptolaemus montrouzieri]|uniref:Ig-like domain-containing protein n=1 Tax=Cryptolaemus montrouzieri TaxID=559131 RepID=A0ABD2NAS1_9CUCU
MISRRISLCYILCFVIYWKHLTVSSLHIINLYVPREASHEALLDCRYSLELNETLYDVKWYKEGSEFFRCKSNGSVLQFPVDGVKLYVSELVQKGTCPLILTGLNEQSSGEYLCEVSLDFTFQSVTKASKLKFVLPSLKDVRKNHLNEDNAQNRTEGLRSRYNLANKCFYYPFLTVVSFLISILCK